MKKTIAIIFIVISLSGCTFLRKLDANCSFSKERTPAGNIVFCLLCDTAVKDIFKPMENDTLPN